MKPGARVYWCLTGLLLFVALFVVLAANRFSTTLPGDWLHVLQVNVVRETNAAIARTTISMTLSNAGPRKLAFKTDWMECRRQSDSGREQLRSVPPGSLRKSIILDRGATTNITFSLDSESAPEQQYLFCSQIAWIEAESGLRSISKVIDGPLYSGASMVGVDWDPPWRHKRLQGGDVFAGNIVVEDFFQKAYGFTRDQWLTEQQSLGRLYSKIEPGSRVIVHVNNDVDPIAMDARLAFSTFCLKTSKGALKPEPGAAPNAAPPHR